MPRAVHSLLVLDERLGAQFSTEALAALHREFPGAEWLLCWERPTPHGVALVWQCRARGGVEWGQSPAQLAEAFDAVLDGELWFSTSVLQQLYLAGLGLHANHAEVHGELTSREAEVLALVRLGHTNKLIAQRLEISVNTVKKHLAHVFDKLGLHSRRQERP